MTDYYKRHTGIVRRSVTSYRVWVKKGATCNAVTSDPAQVWGPPAAPVLPARLPASSDTALCF